MKRKYVVRVQTPNGEKRSTKKCEEDGETIIMKKGHGKEPGWKFKFTPASIISLNKRFGTREAIEVFYNAPKAIEKDFTIPKEEQYKLGLKEVKQFARWEALRQRYSTMQKQGTNWIGIITLVMVGILLFLVLKSSGLM